MNTRISAREWYAGGSYQVIDGYRVFRRTGGADGAPVLLLIHGFPTSSWDWERIWEVLCQHFRVMSFDMLGFGKSDKPQAANYHLAGQADIAESLLRSAGVLKYHVLAHDYGDTVAQELLARHSESGSRPQLLSVCFLNGGLFPETHRPLLAQRLLLSPLGPLMARMMSQQKFRRAMENIFGSATQPNEDFIREHWELMMFNNGRAIFHKLIRYMKERRQFRARWVGALQTAAIPLKVIDGAVDPISGRHMVERYCELVPDPDVSLLEHIGHYPQVEDPEAVLQLYLAFRAGIGN